MIAIFLFNTFIFRKQSSIITYLNYNDKFHDEFQVSQKLNETSILQGQVEQQTSVTTKIEDQLKAKETQVCIFGRSCTSSGVMLCALFLKLCK